MQKDKIFNQLHWPVKTANLVINKLEDPEVPFIYVILTFVFAIQARHFVEILSTHSAIYYNAKGFTHYSLFWIALALSLIILFHLITRAPVPKVARVILPGFLILVIAPLVDLLISGGAGMKMTYLLPRVHSDLLWRFFTLGGSFEGSGITPGMRIEIALALVGSFFYFLTKSSKVIKSILFTILTYAAIFVWGIFPFIIKIIVELLGFEYRASTPLFYSFIAAIIVILAFAVAYLWDKRYTVHIIKGVSLPRLAYYLSMLALGVAIGIKTSEYDLNLMGIFNFLFIIVSLVLAVIFSTITNNVADYEIDRIANANRPLFDKHINFEVYKKLAWPFLFGALLYALLTNFSTLFFIALCIASYFLYSMPPLRLKRITFFSKLAVSLSSLSLVLLGFFTITGSVKSIPNITLPTLLIGITAVANIIDIKDYQGDKKGGIPTLPVVLGLTWAKRLIGLFFLLFYGALFFVIDFIDAPLNSFYVFVFLGIVQVFFINRKKYSEKPIFLVALLTMALIIFLIIRFYQPAA